MAVRRIVLLHRYSLLIIITLLFIGGCSDKNTLSESIIKEINSKCGENSSCTFSMGDITDFEWDKLVVFQVGSSNAEVSDALGFEYKGSTDLMSGLIFVLNNKIVLEKKTPYNPEKPEKLQIKFDKEPNDPSSVSYSLNNAILSGTKTKFDGVSYYGIIAKVDR